MKDVLRKGLLLFCSITLLCCLIVGVSAETSRPELGTIIHGKIAQVGQVNTYMTPCEMDESFYIKAVTTNGKLWPRITVYSPNGQEIKKEYDPSKAEIFITIPARGTYSLLIDDGTSWSQTGDYSLYIQSVTNPTAAIPLSIGSTQSGDVTVPGKTDTYTYTGRTGETLALKATKSSGNLWPRITVYSPSGQKIGSGYDPSKTEAKYNISATGQYVILVDDGTSWNQVGGYSLFSQVFSPAGGTGTVSTPINEVYTVSGNKNPGGVQDNQSGESGFSSSLQPVMLGGVLFMIIGGIALFWWKKQPNSRKASSGGKGTTGHSIQVPSSYEGNVSGTINHDIIISYSTQDKPVADAICAGLEARGIRCWIAPRDILPGVNYLEGIIDAITSSKIMVLIFSSHANESPHVIREATIAMSKNVIIIPFRIDGSPLSKTMEFIISVPHWLDAVTPPLEDHIKELGDTIMILLENERKKQR